MMFEIAFRLKDPDAVQRIEKAIISLAEEGLLIKGCDILAEIKRETSLSISSNLLYDLVKAGIIFTKYPAKNIENYLFDINLDGAGEYFKIESFAADVVQQYEKGKYCAKPFGISYAVTIPVEFTGTAEGFEEIEPALIRLANESEKDLWIVNPFFDEYGAQRLLPSMFGAARSGIKIHILGRGLGKGSETESNAAVRDIASAFIQEDLAHMIEIKNFFRQDDHGYQVYALHTKMMVADEYIAYIGSANLTKHSLRNNFELGVILRGEGVQSLSDLIKRLWQEAEYIELKELVDL